MSSTMLCSHPWPIVPPHPTGPSEAAGGRGLAAIRGCEEPGPCKRYSRFSFGSYKSTITISTTISINSYNYANTYVTLHPNTHTHTPYLRAVARVARVHICSVDAFHLDDYAFHTSLAYRLGASYRHCGGCRRKGSRGHQRLRGTRSLQKILVLLCNAIKRKVSVRFL